MTLTTTTNTATYTGNGSTKDFSFNYLFYSNEDLVVKVNDVTQVLNTDYTVSGSGVQSGGTVSFITAPANAASIVIQRIVEYVQETDFENFDGNPADVTEKQFDLLVMQTQQIAEQTDRTILAPIGTVLSSNTISGSIDSTSKVLTISTSGPAASDIAIISQNIDTIITTPQTGDILEYDGTNWLNVTKASAGLVTLSDNQTITGDIVFSGAVTIPSKSIDVSDLKDGTDGELITWDSSGVATTIAAGTSGQVLTSNGAGAAPTFQNSQSLGGAEIALVTAGGYGSTGTSTIYFTTVETNNGGSDLTYTSDAVNGDYITINTTGIYAVSVEWVSTASGREFGATRNSSSTINNITTLAVNQQICVESGVNDVRSQASRVLNLNANDIIRFQTDKGATSTAAGDCRLSVCRVG